MGAAAGSALVAKPIRTMYQRHPSKQLNDLFSERPYQGADPIRAKFLFVGLDANYEANIASMGIMPFVIEYHSDGQAFWLRHGVHHPFLLPAYPKRAGGGFYHRTFARIGFTQVHADQVSFVELLDVPTVGTSRLEIADLKSNHLNWLDDVIRNGAAKFVFIPPAPALLMRRSGHFPWLSSKHQRIGDHALGVWAVRPGKTIYWHYHFSTYGKSFALKSRQLAEIGGFLSGS